ncbi:MAG: DNA polymerase I [Patescibacteria group bacterium]|jgi:DNA polymerase-1
MKKLMIIDGNAIVHRAYHAIPPLTTRSGVVVNAVYGFVSMLLKVLNEIKPEYVAVTFDEAGPTFRHVKFDKYKATRVKAEQALYDQIPLTREVLGAFNFQIFSKSGYEADDVIGTIVKMTEQEPLEVFIVTGDMDTLQLVSEKVKVYTLRKGINDVVVYDPKGVNERYGFGPDRVIDYKSIRGDASDNIPGVPGIGEKGATELIKKIGSLDQIYKNIKNLKKAGFTDSLIKKLQENEKIARLSYELATLDTKVPNLNFNLEDCRVKPFEREKLVEMFQKYEFISLLKRIPEFKDAPEAGGGEKKNGKKTAVKIDYKYTEISKKAAVDELVEKIKKTKKYAARLVIEGTDIFKNKLNGVALAVGGESYFIPAEMFDKFKTIFLEKDLELIGHDLKPLVKYLEIHENIFIKNKLFDVMIASYILNPGSRAHDIAGLVFKILGKELAAGSGQESLFGIDKRQATYELYLVSQISGQLKNDLEKIDNLGLLEKLEMPLVPVLADMEANGVAVDTKILKDLSTRVAKEIKIITDKIYSHAGMEFNISSPLQLREVLFEKLDISTEGIKKGKTGLSTSAEELDKLKGLHPIVDEISIYRELTKLQNTYIDTLPVLINSTTKRIHSSFNQAITATGRLSSSDPNLQNIPVRTKLGQEVRNAFVAEKGYKLISADYSQIELRVVASLAEDKKMIEIFEKGEDIHQATAAAIHEVPLDKVTKEMRYAAKEINFGVLYGMGVYGLSWRADITHWEAKQFIQKYFEKFSGVKKYIDSTLIFTKKEGYCETLFGRRRYLPELNSSNYQARSAAERMAVNHPVQGTAADLMKMAMIEVYKYLKENFKNEDAKLIMQVHDELVLEVKEKLVAEISNKLKEIMENVVKLRVPVKVEVGAGQSWGETK